MKKFIVGAVALAVALAGFGGLGLNTAQATPQNILTINSNLLDQATTTAGVACTPCDLTDPADLAAVVAGGVSLSALDAASGSQITDTGSAGTLFVVVQLDTSNTEVVFNPKGLAVAATSAADANVDGVITCAELVTADVDCSGGGAGDDNMVAYEIDGRGSVAIGTTVNVTAAQDGTTIGADVTVVGDAHDLLLTVVDNKTTLQEGAASCALTDSTNVPTRAGLRASVVDINDREIVGAPATFGTSSASVLDVASTAQVRTAVQADGSIAAANVACGDTAGTANATVTSTAVAGATRSVEFTVTGVPDQITLTADPAVIPCDGVSSATVTAVVTDANGDPVAAGTTVSFNVVALGTANPINTTADADGMASSTITPLSAADAGVVVTVTSGNAAAQIRIDCQAAVLTPVVPAPTPTAPTGITPPVTGTGGYLADSSAGFPLWTLFALALGGVALTAGTAVARRVSR